MKRQLTLLGLGVLVAAFTVLAGVRLFPFPGIGFASPDGELTCTVKPSCDVGEVDVFRMSDVTNAHAQTADSHPTTYPYTVCCQGPPELSNACSGYDYASVLTLSADDNAHVASDGGYPIDVCLSAPNRDMDCQYGTTCPTDYTCLATISDTTNAHVADCDGTLDYDIKVCCGTLCIDKDGDTSCDEPTADHDDDGCTAAQEAALGSVFDPYAWYDVYDVPVPAKEDAIGDGCGDDLPPIGANGFRNGLVDIGDVLAVLFYAFSYDDGPCNANGVDYDAMKGVDTNADTTNDNAGGVTHELRWEVPGAPPPNPYEGDGVAYDRTPGLGPDPVTGIDPTGEPNGYVDIADVLAVLAQAFVVDCTAGP